ncbi:tRNA (guanine-N(7)-)-methyltransferase non-catalytic subunit wuho [Aplysia californica]|uniref:tRNA (Guanine-N(7)-)-methyltransferase non-catalytic subunit wuho n=1 Tax=Aplysia californica TaxID=6500 RepID=A0ABM1A8Z5_APLCA|nr:tRNA (guanine-N(7)-)-methyltransferase non-catalytic subunit wuho [Aplysia californica]
MVLDMLLIDHDQCVVTCDRDEKIRVSDFPDSYNIRSYCLGHTAFVISLVCDSRQKVLMSGSGDCTVRLWSLQGKQLLTHNVLTDLPSCDVIQDDPNPEPPSTETTDKPSTDGVTTGHRPAIQQLCFCEPCGLLCVAMYRSPQVLIYQLTYPPPSPDPDTDISQPSLSLLTSLSAEGLVLSMSVSGCVLWLLSQRDSILKLSAHRMDGAAGTVQEVEPSATGEGGVSRLLHVIGGQADFLTVTDLGAPDPIPHLWKSHTDGYIEEYKERKRQRMEGKEESRWGRKHQRRPERQTKR